MKRDIVSEFLEAYRDPRALHLAGVAVGVGYACLKGYEAVTGNPVADAYEAVFLGAGIGFTASSVTIDSVNRNRPLTTKL